MSSCDVIAGSTKKYKLDSAVKPQNDRTMDKQYYVYILASRRNGTLYIGITSDLIRRIWEHKNKAVAGFSSRYGVDKLVYYEIFDDPENAIKREKRLKFYTRKWKIDLIEKTNPEWKDLYQDII